MTRIYLVIAVAASCTDAFFLRYLRFDGGKWSPEFHEENKSSVFTNGGALKIDAALGDAALGDAARAGATSGFDLLLQSPVVWRGGPSVERSMVRVKDTQDLLPISAAVVMMSKGCTVTERVPKKLFVEALKAAKGESDGSPRSFGKGMLPPWKAVFGFLRRHFGEGERLKGECKPELAGGVPAKFAIASKGAVATSWEHGGCQKKKPELLYPSLQAKHLYVPYYTESSFNLVQIDVLKRDQPTFCWMHVKRSAELSGCKVGEEYKPNDIVFEQGRVRLLAEGEAPGPKALLVLRALPYADDAEMVDPPVRQSEKEISVTGLHVTVFFAKRRGGWDAQRSLTPVKFVKATNDSPTAA